MMRPIKFRGKNFGTGQWDYATPEDYHWEQFWTMTTRESRGQFTGLKDKNGVEVYEGDIVIDARWPEMPFDVKWCNGKEENLGNQVGWILDDTRFCPTGHIVEFTAHLAWNESDREEYYNGEVIGNIYETIELLESHHATS